MKVTVELVRAPLRDLPLPRVIINVWTEDTKELIGHLDITAYEAATLLKQLEAESDIVGLKERVL